MGLAAALGTGCIILGLSLLPVGEYPGTQNHFFRSSAFFLDFLTSSSLRCRMSSRSASDFRQALVEERNQKIEMTRARMTDQNRQIEQQNATIDMYKKQLVPPES